MSFAVSQAGVVYLFNIQNINLHAELESIFTSYPSKKDSVEVPKGFKVRNMTVLTVST